MKSLLHSSLGVLLATSLLFAASKEEQRLANSATVLEEILSVPDGIPLELMDKAECVMVIPSVKKFAIGIGGSYGRGAMVCRRGKNFTGPWGPPAMFRLEGANIGFQLGGQATDFILLLLNPGGADSLLRSKVKLGADAAVVAGPKGRVAMAATDAYMRAEILSYSRSRGLFAGVSLEGSTLRQDNKANQKVYGRKISAREIVLESTVPVPPSGRRLVSLLQKVSPRNRSEQVASPEPAAYRSTETEEGVAVGTVVVLTPGVRALNVRTLPLLEGAVIGRITPGQEFTVLEIQNNWCLIQLTPESQGWASGKYLQQITKMESASQAISFGSGEVAPPPPDVLYNTALRDYTSGNYPLALQEFTDYLRYYADTPLASNSQFYVGDIYYQQGQFEKALQEYDKAIEQYPNGNKSAAAQLKKGYALINLNLRTQGARELSSLLQRFPNTPEARLAENKLTTLEMEPETAR